MDSLIVRALKRWWNSDPATHGAAIAYYAIFSIAPISIVLVVVFGRLFGTQIVESRLFGAVQGFVGSDISDFARVLLSYARRPVEGFVAAWASAAVIVVGALALFTQVQRSLESMWHDDTGEVAKKSFIMARVIAVGMVFILGVFLILSFAANAVTAYLIRAIDPSLISAGKLIEMANTAFSFGYIFILFSLMYKYLPHKPVSWSASFAGGLVGGVLFIIGRFFLSLYFTAYLASTIYGAAGAVVLVLIWFYYSAQILFFGGAVACAIDQMQDMRETS